MLINKRSEVKGSSTEKQNFGLNNQEFDQMLADLQQGNDQLFERVFLSHFGDCMQFLKNKYKVQQFEAYDASMDALLAFRKRLIDGKIHYGNMRFLFTKIAGQFLMAEKKQGTFDYHESEDKRTDQPQNNLELLQALDKAWIQLPPENKDVLEQYYYNKTPLKILATAKNITEAAMRKQKQRSMEKLKKYLVNQLG